MGAQGLRTVGIVNCNVGSNCEIDSMGERLSYKPVGTSRDCIAEWRNQTVLFSKYKFVPVFGRGILFLAYFYQCGSSLFMCIYTLKKLCYWSVKMAMRMKRSEKGSRFCSVQYFLLVKGFMQYESTEWQHSIM